MHADWMKLIAAAAVLLACSQAASPYYGTEIGPFKSYAHDVEGTVYAVDDRTLFIKDFSYDGQGPDAFFWAGTTSKPDTSGFIVPDEKGKKTPLLEYRHRDLLLRLPAGKTLRNTKWIAVWCRKFTANFADIFIPSDLQIPQPLEIGRLPTKDHGVSSGPVMVVDTQTLLVPDFIYDGLGPAAYWWVSRGARQHPRGLRLANEDGSLAPLVKYTGRTVVITLPGEYTVHDFDWFGVWCEEARVDFGSVALPHSIVVPPSPRTLGIELEYKLNCEVLRDDLGYEVRWIMDGEDIVMQLVARLESGDYMSFGLSKNDSSSEMVKADAIVAWIDKKRKGHAVDYYLESKEQCVGRRGSCPDTKFPDGQNSVTLLNAAAVNGYTMVTVKRPQVGLDEKYDQHIYSDGPQAIVWAIGPLNDKGEVSYHGAMRSEGDVYIDFARSPQWNCPQPLEPDTEPPPTTTTTTTKKPTKKPERSTSPSSRSRRPQQQYASRTAASDVRVTKVAWRVPPIVCPADRTFRAQIGPSGGKKGFQEITGQVGWGLAWYINGMLVPELTVERGKTYTFIVEGGDDPDNLARTHPLYITDDPEGGYEHKTSAEKKRVKVYGGVSSDRRGKHIPTAKGRMCEYKLPKNLAADDFATFESFQENLELKCDRGKQGRLTFKPDKDTPDLLYYQCYTHRHLGWKINVVDSCQDTLRHEASIQHVRNISYNSFESDYKRGGGGEKKNSKDSWKDDSKEDRSPAHATHKTSAQTPAHEGPHHRPSTTETKERIQYFYTTPEQRSLYKFKTTRPPPPPTQRAVTMESFNLGDVIHSPGPRNNYFYNDQQVSNPRYQPEAIKLKVYESPQRSIPQQQYKQRPQQDVSGAVNALRSQIANMQNVRKERPSGEEDIRHYRTQQQRHSGYRNATYVPRQQQSLSQILSAAGQNVIPVILHSTGKNHRQFVPPSRPLTRRPSEATYHHYKAEASSYLPVIVQRESANKSRDVPLVPVVLDESEGSNLQTLQQILSMLNANPQSIKIVNLNQHHRSRIARNADHHPGHDHENHDHKHEGHEKHHKDPAEKSFGICLFMSVQTLVAICLASGYLSRRLV